MNETAGMLDARLELIDRVRRIEHLLARGEQARIARELMRGFSHELGNQVQILSLCAQELGRRAPQELQELIDDMTKAAQQATGTLAQMVATARPSDREIVGPDAASAVRAAVDLARPAIASTIELHIDLADSVPTYATSEELEALVLASLLDAAPANRMHLLLRERVIQNKRWVELLRIDDRHHLLEGDFAHMFEPHSLLHVVAGVARLAGGEASLAPGRGGLELAVELPVATARAA
jgi:nitrogen-specific signal transduction histidine kinase